MWYNYFGMLEFTEHLQLPEEGLDSELRSIPALSTETPTILHPNLVAGSWAQDSWSSLWESEWAKGHYPPNIKELVENFQNLMKDMNINSQET